MPEAPTTLFEAVVALGEPSADSPCPFENVAAEVFNHKTSDEAIVRVTAEPPSLVVIRDTVPTHEGLNLLSRLRAQAPGVPAVAVSRNPDVEAAIAFIRGGAADYVAGELTDGVCERLRALARRRSDGRDRFFAPECPAGVEIVGQSSGLRRHLDLLTRVAQSGCNPVLVTGETGTGKELAARAVHALRGGKPEDFVAVNCATLTANLLESELFGHTKGAFTGADRDKAGLFELAEGGSIFLDEITEMPVGLQAKLLRVLQERRFRKVGGTADIECKATVIASSNRDLAEAVADGDFRQDLYYRLAVVPVALPPLRSAERRDDIPLLAEYFVETLGMGRCEGLSEQALEALAKHPWPGNVRELRNVIERALILEPGDVITPASLLLSADTAPDAGQTALPVPEDDFSLETAERLFIRRALEQTGGQRTRAAALLGITRATLHAKLKRYKIAIPPAGGSNGSGAANPSSLAEACA